MTVKSYRGIVKGNTVILEQKPDVDDGAEALVLVKASEDEEKEGLLPTEWVKIWRFTLQSL